MSSKAGPSLRFPGLGRVLIAPCLPCSSLQGSCSCREALSFLVSFVSSVKGVEGSLDLGMVQD